MMSEQTPTAKYILVEYKFDVNAALPTHQASIHTPACRQQWGRTFLLTTLLAMPIPASAQTNWFCNLFPWLCPTSCGSGLDETNSFGSNPGNLKMCSHVPDNLDSSRPLVVALHGCAQQASDYDNETGWVDFADKYHFALLLPQQSQANHQFKCFNWFNATDNARNEGEALSIKEMIEKMKADHSIDNNKVYVTGLSAGGAMTAVMLSTYPELFAGGAILAGIPYGCANIESQASQCGVSLSGQVSPVKDLTPTAWGDLVREASEFSGPYSPVSIWHGTSDTTVNPVDQRESMEQWTNVLQIDQTPDTEDTINGHQRRLYKDHTNKALVETILVNGLGHATPIDPGNGVDQCGTGGQYVRDAGICSSYHIIKFWGLDQP